MADRTCKNVAVRSREARATANPFFSHLLHEIWASYYFAVLHNLFPRSQQCRASSAELFSPTSVTQEWQSAMPQCIMSPLTPWCGAQLLASKMRAPQDSYKVEQHSLFGWASHLSIRKKNVHLQQCFTNEKLKVQCASRLSTLSPCNYESGRGSQNEQHHPTPTSPCGNLRQVCVRLNRRGQHVTLA